MKNKILKSIFALIMTFMTLPMMGQDWMNVYFKDGSNRKFYLKDITEITTSRLDAEGVSHSDYEYQHIKTHHNKYVYAINDVDSVTFTKYNKDKVKENLSLAIPAIFSILEDCDDLLDAEKNIQQFNNATGVERAWTDGHQLFVSIDGWETMSFNFSHDVEKATARQAMDRNVEYVKNLNKITKALSPTGKELKAAIIIQQHYDESRRDYVDDYYLPLKKELESCNIFTRYFDKPTLSVFSDSIFNYDLVFLVTHGGYINREGNNVHVLETADESGVVPKKNWIEWWKESKEDKEEEFLSILEAKRALYPESTSNHIYGDWQEETRNGVRCWVYYAIITETFFEDYANGKFENANSILFNTACQSLKGNKYETNGIYFSDGLAEKFFNQGLGLYLGYNETNSVGKKAGPKMIKSLLDGYSVTKAFTDLPSDYQLEYYEGKRADLLGIHNPLSTLVNNSFLIQTHTNQVSNDVVTSQYNYGKFVEVEGLATTLNPEALSFGFVYDTNEKLNNPHHITDVQVMPLLQMLENGNGNLLFRAKIPNLELGQTYFYCAYSCDDLNYNYGDTLSFTIYPPLTLSSNSITVPALTSSSGVSIISGSGSYSIFDNTAPDVVTAKIIDNKSIAFEAHKTGTATITVKDDKSGQTATIEVTVQAKDIPSEVIDLGLPSGTLWASYNVGATKPEEYGDYYAWGETEMKETCRWKNYSHCEGTQETCVNLGSNISGTKYDVAHAKWGGEWRLPTRDQIKELMNNCTSAWTTVSGVNGIMFTGPNGKTVFFPAAGYLGSEVLNSGSYGYYWSGDQDPKNAERAYNLSIQNGDLYCVNNYRFAGFSVRPVMSGLELSHTGTLSMLEGESETLTINSGSGSYRYEIDKNDIVSVSIKGKLLTINALKTGDATITVIDTNTDQIANIPVVVNAIPVAIDLGLPSGTKWASFNVGANKPEEYGNYYSWGETEVRDQYYFTTYSLCDGTVTSCHDIGENISGTEYDVAHVKWGGEWCMPTKDDFQELAYNCEYKETSVNGVKGLQFTGPNGQYIFLPYSGYVWNTENDKAGSEGSYWSATQTTNVNRAHEMNFKKDEVLWNCYINRFAGLTVRPVIHSTLALADLTLSSTEPIKVKVDDKATIEITSGNGNYTAKSDNEDVAIARVENNATVIIKGISTGSATVTVTDTQSGQTASIEVTVTSDDIVPYLTCPDDHHPHMIDLGLPSGKKWACCNVDAISPEDYGGYYAWFETEVKDDYSWSTYIHADGTEYSFHINDIFEDTFWEQNDVAHMKWGGSWMVPSSDDFKELKKYCTYQWTSRYGIEGAKFTSKNNGNCVFFPAAGYKSGIYRYGANSHGDYWSRGATLDYDENWLYGYSFSFGSTGSVVVDTAPYEGLPVRPVWK